MRSTAILCTCIQKKGRECGRLGKPGGGAPKPDRGPDHDPCPSVPIPFDMTGSRGEILGVLTLHVPVPDVFIPCAVVHTTGILGKVASEAGARNHLRKWTPSAEFVFFVFFFSKAWGPFFPPWYKGQISVFLSFCRENCATHRLVRAKKISSAALWHWGSEGKYVRTLRRASRRSRLSNNEIASSTHYGEIHGICAAA